MEVPKSGKVLIFLMCCAFLLQTRAYAESEYYTKNCLEGTWGESTSGNVYTLRKGLSWKLTFRKYAHLYEITAVSEDGSQVGHFFTDLRYPAFSGFIANYDEGGHPVFEKADLTIINCREIMVGPFKPSISFRRLAGDPVGLPDTSHEVSNDVINPDTGHHPAADRHKAAIAAKQATPATSVTGQASSDAILPTVFCNATPGEQCAFHIHDIHGSINVVIDGGKRHTYNASVIGAKYCVNWGPPHAVPTPSWPSCIEWPTGRGGGPNISGHNRGTMKAGDNQ